MTRLACENKVVYKYGQIWTTVYHYGSRKENRYQIISFEKEVRLDLY